MLRKSITIQYGLFFLFLVAMASCNNITDENSNWTMNEISIEKIAELQQQYNDGHRPGLADPSQVAMEFFDSQADIEVDQIVEPKFIIKELSKQVVQYKLIDGRSIQLELIRPDNTGDSGIFIVHRYRFVDE